jgi:hypothetical protein
MQQFAESVGACGVPSRARGKLQRFGEGQFVERIGEACAAGCGVEAGLVDAEEACQDQ